MAKHGYQVKFGYFHGVCQGSVHAPLELERSYLDFTVEALRAYATRQKMFAERLASGADLPEKALRRREPYGDVVHERVPGSRWETRPVEVLWHEATPLEQKMQREADIGMHEAEAQGARHHADWLVELAAKVHGQPLIDREAARGRLL